MAQRPPTEPPPASYIHGHHPSVLRSHTWRTAQNSAAYLLPHIHSTSKILDIGCGPGTITCDFASRASSGNVIGIDASESVLEKARATAEEREIKNVTFATGDIYNLAYGDETFDVVHVHQVLQHISDPVVALREMKRVTKKGGVVAARETDISAAVWWPMDPVMREWQECYCKTAKSKGGNPDAGRKLHVYAREVGFEKVQVSADAYCYVEDVERKFWAELWADRLEQSELRGNMLNSGFATEADIAEQVKMWRRFAGNVDAQFTLVHGQTLCYV